MGERATGIAVVAANPPERSRQQGPVVARPQPMSGVIGPAPPPGAALPRRIRVSQNAMNGLLASHVEPVYPAMEKINIEGSVVLNVIIGKDGTVQSAKVIKAPSPLLIPPALDAVKQWKYKPYLLNGTPIEVDTNATVNFTLPKK